MGHSLQAKGSRDDSPAKAKPLLLDDAKAAPGQQSAAMRKNEAFLCQRPDGSERYYTIDAERSVPGQPPILILVGNP